MLDQLTKSVSLAALAGLYLAAKFNIGFFYALGYHFIGVIDVPNIVYTFGLVIVFVFIGIALISLTSLVATGAKTFGSSYRILLRRFLFFVQWAPYLSYLRCFTELKTKKRRNLELRF